MFQNRVNPNNLARLSKQETGVGEYWISPNEEDLRPYDICIKKTTTVIPVIPVIPVTPQQCHIT